MNSPDTASRLNSALKGRYRVERQLGEGGMATVYLADDLKHERKVALKVLKPELAAVVGAERFLAEIKTTANLTHPNILPLHDSGESDGFLYYVMPFIEGETLRDRLEREKQLPVDEAIRIATDVAEALHSAHKQGVIHRDVKPANILLSEGRPLVADFGIALAVSAAGGGRLTETGLSMGTPYYMSPEQASADRDPSAASDVYSLGCVLYEMLVGEPPYTGGSAQAVLAKILTDPAPAPAKVRGSIRPNVDAAIRKALEKLPADRFTGAQEFVRALADPGFRHGELAAAGVTVGRGLWNPLAIGLGVLALVFALTTGWSLLGPAPPAPVGRFESPFREGEVPTGWVELTPDGSALVYVGPGESGEGSQLWVRSWDELDARPIPGTELATPLTFLALSPDGREVAFIEGQAVGVTGPLRVVPLAGGQSRTLVEGASNASWSDDGWVYFTAVDLTIHRVRESGGPNETVTELSEGELFHSFPQFLPGGRHLLFGVWRAGDGSDAAVWAVDLETRERKLLTPGIVARYTASGHLLFGTTDGQLMAAPFDARRAELTGDAVPVAEGLSTNPTIGFVAYSVSGDGSLVYLTGGVASGQQQLIVVDLEGNVEPLVLAPRNFQFVAWSPDGQSVVYDSEGQIYTYNVALGTTPRQLTFEGVSFVPVYSPDGSRVAFSSIREGTDGPDLFVKDLTDNFLPRSVITLPANQLPTQWPSDTLIVFERGEGGLGDLWTVDLSDPDSARAVAYLSSEADLRRMVVSPDGTLAAYRSNESGQIEVYVRSFPDPGERTKVSENGGAKPFWSPDGNTLYYERFDPAGESTFMAARTERDPVPVVLSTDSLFTVASITALAAGSALHPDGDRFILAQNVSTSGVEDGAPEPSRLILVQNFFEELKRLVPN